MSELLFNKLHKEISDIQNRRFKLVILKIGFVTALLGLGSIKISTLQDLEYLLFIAPLPAVFFDLMILGESFAIRRIGKFLREQNQDLLIKEYEQFIYNNPDIFYKIACYGLTALAVVASYLLYGLKFPENAGTSLLLGSSVLVIITAGYYICQKRIKI